MKKPSSQEIMEAYLMDLQKEIAMAEKLKQEVESMRTENWSLEKRNSELKKGVVEMEALEKRVKQEREYVDKRSNELDERQRNINHQTEELNTKQVKLIEDLNHYEKLKTEIDQRLKNIIDQEKAIEAKEYDIDIERGKLEQKLKIYRDKLKI